MKRISTCLILLAAFSFLPHARAEWTTDKLIDHMSERMLALKSIDQRAEMVVTFDMEGDQEEMIQASRLVYQRSNQLRIESEMLTVLSDGQAVSIILPQFEHFVQFPIETSLHDTLEAHREFIGGVAFPDVVALLSHDPRAALAEIAAELTIEVEGEQERNGRPAWLIRVRIEDDTVMLKEDLRVWIDQETGLVSGMAAEVDLSALMEGATMEGVPSGYSMDYRLTDIAVNKELPEDVFLYNTTGYTQVDSFDDLTDAIHETAEADLPQAIAPGEPAPDFELTLLDGAHFQLSDHLGKVVLVDFWATWCPPCVESLPYLQSMYEELASDDLVFIGVSLDRPGMESRVKSMLERFQIEYLIGINEGGAIAMEYGAVSIPTLVIVDREGIVQHQKVGFSPAAMEEVKDVLTALLAGE